MQNLIVTTYTREELKEMFREVLMDMLKSDPSLPDEITAQEAAAILRYKDVNSLVTYERSGHLHPVRRGKRKFYTSAEVLKLKQIIFK